MHYNCTDLRWATANSVSRRPVIARELVQKLFRCRPTMTAVHSSVIRSRTHSILLYAFLQKMISRFLGRSLVYALTFPIAVNAQSASNQSRLGILLITPGNVLSSSPAASAARGVRLGSAEAKQTARLFGADVELVEGSGPSGVAAATKMLAGRQVQVIIGTSPGDAEDLAGDVAVGG